MKLRFIALFYVVPGMACAQEMKMGRWEVTIKSEMTGIPVPPQSHTITYCIDEKTKDRPIVGNDMCKFNDKRVEGNQISWKMACDGDPKMMGEITKVFESDRFSGRSNMTIHMSGGPQMAVKGTYSGKYLGPCS